MLLGSIIHGRAWIHNVLGVFSVAPHRSPFPNFLRCMDRIPFLQQTQVRTCVCFRCSSNILLALSVFPTSQQRLNLERARDVRGARKGERETKGKKREGEQDRNKERLERREQRERRKGVGKKSPGIAFLFSQLFTTSSHERSFLSLYRVGSFGFDDA